nr:protein root hair defective 3 homolog 2 [Tanacetum cinerariifolium]
VASLRQKFFQSIAPGGLAGDRRGVVPALGFSFSTQQIWKVIKENKDLDLPAHKLIQPAYQLMLEHIRSGTLDYFKKALNDALNSGQGFAAAARDCINKFAKLFDDQCEGTSTSFLKFLAIKQLAINWWDEYGFVIHPGLVGLTCKSVRIDMRSDRFNFKKNLLDRISSISKTYLIPRQDHKDDA